MRCGRGLLQPGGAELSDVSHDSWHTERYQDPGAPLKAYSAGLQGRGYEAQTYSKDVMTLVIECYDK